MSSDLLTNTSAMTALLQLNQTQQSLNTYENQISTGMAVSQASDNASYWSIASTMNSQIGMLGAVSGSLSQSASMLQTMSNALSTTVSIMNNLGADLQEAAGYIGSGQTPSLAEVQSDIAQQQQLLQSIGKSSNVNGANLLDTSGGTVNILASYTAQSGASYISIDTSNIALFNTAGGSASGGILASNGTNYSSASILTMDVTNATAGDITNMLADYQTALHAITTAASSIGASQNNVTAQQTFISNLSDSLTDAVGSLVDADMNEASTKISALQVQQQLGVQALSIANSNTQLILKLFEG